MDKAKFASMVKSQTTFTDGSSGPVGFDITLIISLLSALMPVIMKMLENCKKKPEDLAIQSKKSGLFQRIKVMQQVKRHCKKHGWADGDYANVTEGLFQAAGKLNKGECSALLSK